MIKTVSLWVILRNPLTQEAELVNNMELFSLAQVVLSEIPEAIER